MDVTAIAAASITMHQSQLQQAVSVTMMRKAMDLQESQAAAMIQSLQQPAAAGVPGQRLDLLA